MTRAIVIGQSHSTAIAEALAGEGSAADGIVVYRLGDARDGSGTTEISIDEAVAVVSGLETGTPVFLSIIGTYHNVLGMLRSGEEFDILLGTEKPLESHAKAVIPYRALASAFTLEFARARSIQKIKTAARSPLYLLSSPPPKQSNEFMMQQLTRQKGSSYRGKIVREVGVERADSRLKLWNVEVNLAKAWAQSQGMQFVPAPKEAFNADGFLSRKFYWKDATHANARYGALVVQQIREIIKAERQERIDG